MLLNMAQAVHDFIVHILKAHAYVDKQILTKPMPRSRIGSVSTASWAWDRVVACSGHLWVSMPRHTGGSNQSRRDCMRVQLYSPEYCCGLPLV